MSEENSRSHIGHNSVAGDQLKAFIERVERVTEEKDGLTQDIRDIYGEAKAVGFDPKIMRKIVKMRKQDKAKREEEEHLTETYLHALGMI